MMTGTDVGANGCAGVPADEQRARLETEAEERQRELITLQDAHDKLLAEMQQMRDESDQNEERLRSTNMQLVQVRTLNPDLVARMQRAECPRFPVLPCRIRRAFLCAFLRRVITASCLAGDEAARPA